MSAGCRWALLGSSRRSSTLRSITNEPGISPCRRRSSTGGCRRGVRAALQVRRLGRPGAGVRRRAGSTRSSTGAHPGPPGMLVRTAVSAPPSSSRTSWSRWWCVQRTLVAGQWYAIGHVVYMTATERHELAGPDPTGVLSRPADEGLVEGSRHDGEGTGCRSMVVELEAGAMRPADEPRLDGRRREQPCELALGRDGVSADPMARRGRPSTAVRVASTSWPIGPDDEGWTARAAAGQRSEVTVSEGWRASEDTELGIWSPGRCGRSSTEPRHRIERRPVRFSSHLVNFLHDGISFRKQGSETDGEDRRARCLGARTGSD